MNRILEPELLDALPPTHPEALRNRRDLRLTNAVMRNHAWFRRLLPRLARPGERVLEIGAGTGELAIELAQRAIAVDGLDLWPQPACWPAGHVWHRADLREFDGWGEYPVVCGNLILHQFSAADLAELGRNLRTTRLILACEPTRRRASQLAYAIVARLLGANAVTLHDARVSIAAGFRGDELGRALGLEAAEWQVQCETTFLGAYHMVAIRRS